MGTRTVIGVDRRSWSVKRTLEWSEPASGDDFEHDVDGGRGAALFILSALFLFWVTLVVWSPALVHVPWYFYLFALAILAFFPIRWLLRRPWKVVAETAGDYTKNQSPERWVGLVRGEAKSREEMRVLKRRLEIQGSPGGADSPLQPVS